MPSPRIGGSSTVPLDAALTKMVSFVEVSPLDNPEGPSKLERARRVIKRYSNRKLYDTRESKYVTLLQIAGMVRAGEDVQIIDNATKEDKTEVTLALIISEELKSQPRSVPLGTLRDLIHQRGEKLLSQLRDGPIGRLIPGVDGKPGEILPETTATDKVEPPPKLETPKVETTKSLSLQGIVETSKQALDHWQQAVDERIRAVLPNFSAFKDLQSEVKK